MDLIGRCWIGTNHLPQMDPIVMQGVRWLRVAKICQLCQPSPRPTWLVTRSFAGNSFVDLDSFLFHTSGAVIQMSLFDFAASVARFLKPGNKRAPNLSLNTNDTNDYEPTVEDVLSVRKLFLKLVPMELIDQIIDFAEYWPHNTIEFSENVTVSNNGEVLYLQSKSLPGMFIPEDETVLDGIKIGNARTVTPGRKVVFRIWSRDQGWSSNDGIGTYKGSFSWFEAVLERPLTVEAARGINTTPELIDLSSLTRTELGNPPPSSPVDRKDGLSICQLGLSLKTVAIPRRDTGETVERWHVQSNVHAGDEIKKHTIIWGWDDLPELCSKNGAGYGGDFVRSMRSGDRISVIARARYPGWKNIIERMEIDIYYAV